MANEILKQGQQYAGGIVNYNTATGQKLAEGGTTLATPNIPVSSITPQTPIDITNSVVEPIDNGSNVVAGGKAKKNQFAPYYQKMIEPPKPTKKKSIENFI